MPESLSRRHFLEASGFGIATALAAPAATDAFAASAGTDALAASAGTDGLAASSYGSGKVKPNQALQLLMAGNRRWVMGRLTHPNESVARRRALRDQQNPFATVFSCIDSRVPPEVVFDRGIGDLAVIRTGAQVLDAGVVLGSVEFAPDHLATPLILVMGHQRCGAVKAAIETIQTGGTAPGHIQLVVDALRPAYAVAISQRGNLLDNMVRAQTKLAVNALRAAPLIKEFISQGKLRVVGGYYSLDTGAVSIIAK
jgi:carbonic anhydrase